MRIRLTSFQFKTNVPIEACLSRVENLPATRSRWKYPHEVTTQQDEAGASYVASAGTVHVYGQLIERDNGKTGVSGYAEYNAIPLLPFMVVFGGFSLLALIVDFTIGLLLVAFVFMIFMGQITHAYTVAQKILEEVEYAIVE